MKSRKLTFRPIASVHRTETFGFVVTSWQSGTVAPSKLDGLECEIAATEAEIDERGYELYGTTDEERSIIEGG